jgi:hypothetical protein
MPKIDGLDIMFARDLTNEETRVIRDLNRLAKRWPRTLWVFCGAGFTVLKCKPDGSRAMNSEGSVDQRYIVASFPIPSDGGDY